jgi:hypothetical protein
VDSVSHLLKETFTEVIENELTLTRYPRLRDFFLRRLDQGVDDVILGAQVKVESYVEREKIPYTQNDYLSETLSKLRSKRLEEALFDNLGLLSFVTNETLNKTTVKLAITSIFDRNRAKHIDDHMAEDMEHVLDAYGKVALKRFIDEVPMICGSVLHRYPDHMEESLFNVTADDLRKLVSDSREFKSNFTNVKRKVDDLQEGLKILEELTF